MIRISKHISLAEDEIDITAIRAQGAGGQNVNKVASAVHLRFDISSSSLPDAVKARLMQRSDRRITDSGVIVIKAQEQRTLERNRDSAYRRLTEIIRSALVTAKKRKPTRPTRSSHQRRMDRKTRRGKLKALRRPVR